MDQLTARGHFAITKSNATVFRADALFVGGAGDVACVDLDGTAVTYTVAAGTQIPVQCKQVLETGTTATNIVGLIL